MYDASWKMMIAGISVVHPPVQAPIKPPTMVCSENCSRKSPGSTLYGDHDAAVDMAVWDAPNSQRISSTSPGHHNCPASVSWIVLGDASIFNGSMSCFQGMDPFCILKLLMFISMESQSSQSMEQAAMTKRIFPDLKAIPSLPRWFTEELIQIKTGFPLKGRAWDHCGSLFAQLVSRRSFSRARLTVSSCATMC